MYSPGTFAPGRRKGHGKMSVSDQGGSKDVEGTGVLHDAERDQLLRPLHPEPQGGMSHS